MRPSVANGSSRTVPGTAISIIQAKDDNIFLKELAIVCRGRFALTRWNRHGSNLISQVLFLTRRNADPGGENVGDPIARICRDKSVSPLHGVNCFAASVLN